MADPGFDFDACVVGAGAVGLACGYALSTRGLSVLVLEKEAAIGQGISSRNSEVIHGGLYYPTASIKARACVAGRRLLYAFLDKHGVAYDRCGKLVVATDESQVNQLVAIEGQARANGVEGIAWLSGAEATALEPRLSCVAAVISPQSGEFDSHGYMLALQGEIEAHGGTVVCSTPFESATPLPGGGFSLRTGGTDAAEISCGRLVTAAGLSAQAVAARVQGFPAERIPALHYGKGVYFVLHGPAPFSRLIYPPPIHGALGMHYRRDLGGQARFGPDLQYVDHEDYTVDPARVASFVGAIRKFWPGLPDDALSPDYAGIRPKLHGPDQEQPDFRLDGPEAHGIPGLMALFGIESPGLTSSLALGEMVCERLGL